MDKIVCHGARRNNDFTFTLMDEWIGPTQSISREEALHEIAIRYFTSHGPATLRDFVWWSGLTIGDARKALELATALLQQEAIEGENFWFVSNKTAAKIKHRMHLLAGFDEYVMGYTNRSHFLESNHSKKVYTPNGIFKPVILFDGQIVGTWKRTIKKDSVFIETDVFKPLAKNQQSVLNSLLKNYGHFVAKSVKMV